jgi:hypothetical protein
MNFKLFFEMFGAFNYFVPSDKEKQMYDFYMLANLRGVANKRSTIQFGGVAGVKPFYEPGGFEDLESEEKQLDYMLEEVADKLLPYLKKEFLAVLLQSVAGEVKDALYFNDTYMLDLLMKHESPDESEAFSDFIMELVSRMHPITDDASDFYGDHDKWSDEEIDNISHEDSEDFKDYQNWHKRSFGHNDSGVKFQRDIDSKSVLEIAMKYFKEHAFMKIAKILFLKADWNESYGGKNWAQIADAYGKLYYANNKNQLMVAIDHVYDLQHNNGSIFTKNSDYAKKTTVISSMGYKSERLDYGWIQNALDFKRDLKSIKELIDKVSPQMKKLAARIIKAKHIE